MKPSSSIFAVAAFAVLASCSPKEAPPVRSALPAAPALVAGSPVVTPKGSIPQGANVMKVGLLLPLSGDSANIGNSMLDAASLALYDSYLAAEPSRIRTEIILIPKDTGSTPAESATAAQQALAQGATFLIGPMFSQSVTAVAPIIKDKNINMVTFSNNMAVAGNGAYVFGFLPELQVKRVAEYAFLRNYPRVAVLAPNDAYGLKVKDTLKDIYTQKGGLVSPIALYAPSQANIDAAVARLAAAYSNTPEERRFQAIFLADGGFQLKTIIEAMKRNNLDLKKIKLLGTGLWDSEDITKIPEMSGAWFSSSPPEPYKVFERRFVTSFGYKPARLSSLAYDAVGLVAAIAMPNNASTIDAAALTNPKGYISPANGLFRFNANGTAERRLAIMEVTPDGFKVLEPAEKSF